jgi:hypothetical protein
MNNATKFYIKKNEQIWSSLQEVSINDIFDKYKFYPESWLLKKIFPVIIWLLKKMKLKSSASVASIKTMNYKSYNIESYDLFQLILKHKIDIEYIWKEKPKYLVMGNDIFYKLMHEAPNNFTIFQQELLLQRQYDYYDDFNAYNNKSMNKDIERMFWGFKVVIVPWINGLFLLPDF